MTAPATRPATGLLWRGLDEVPADLGPSVVTIGVFDGVHRGHVQLIEESVRIGHSVEAPTVLITFDPHPAEFLCLPRDTSALSTPARRADLAFQLGVQAVCVLPFNQRLATLSPAEFVKHVLVDRLHARAVAVGANFTFGHRAAGTVNTLSELGAQHDFTTHSVGLLRQANVRCSSTHIRSCLRRGDIQSATQALGRPHHVAGTLRLFSPHATELVVAANTALPAPGPYLGRLTGGGPAELWITEDERVLVKAPGLRPGPSGVDFIDRASIA